MPSPLLRSLVIASGILLMSVPGTRADDPAAARFRGTGTADPIRIDNVATVAGKVAGQAGIRCDVAWEHSWRAAWKVPAEAHGGTTPLDLENWDAAWLFAKYRTPGADGWSPATLSATAADHAAPPAARLDVGLADDGKTAAGVFAFRAAAGAGPNDWKGITLRWLHAADGVADPAAVEVKVFAIKMVYVPECSFWLGDGATEFIAAQFSAGDSSAPYRMESEAELTLGGTDPRNLGNRDTIGQWMRSDDFTSGTPQTLPAQFPKGYAAFYCMRHELTEGQVVEYLNSLSSQTQKANPAMFGEEKNRSYHNTPMAGITVEKFWTSGTPAVYTTQTPDVACNYVMAYEGRAYAAWAGLRPMTELEYEKAARGPLKPIPDEYAWGSTALVGAEKSAPPTCPRGGYVVANAGRPDERITWQGEKGPDATRGNAVWLGATRCEGRSTTPPDAVQRPLRVEIFATPESDRIAAGASYWGIMELAGNVAERVIPVGNISGRRFTGGHGVPQPPSVSFGSGGGLRRPEEWSWGTGVRGGSMNSGNRTLVVSDRQQVSLASPVIPTRHRSHNNGVGFRCVRTARIVPRPAAAGETALTPLHLNYSEQVQGATSGWEADALVTIKNLVVAPRDDRTATLTFDISWPMSWRTEHNHDAAWVFFKANGAGTGWRHVKLVADRVINPTGYGQADVAGTTKVDCIVPDGPDGSTGLFVRRAAPGKGPMEAQRVTVVCAAESVKNLAAGKDQVRGLGVPMVYVPEGAFSLGSYGAEVGAFYECGDGKTPVTAYRVTGPGPIPVGRQPGRLWARNHGGALQEGEIPATYPNGYAAFYCMRFHLTPSLYADMLNMIDPKIAERLYPPKDRHTFNKTVYSGKNGHVHKGEDGVYVGRPGRERGGPGCFGISWADGATFAAWAGLRPMTELELEKAVRGPRKPAPEEIGPSYWGISGFGGEDWDAFKGDPQCERPVTAGPAGLRFKATHGMGTTTLPADWPQADAVGSGVRCSHYSSDNLERLRGLVESPGFFQPTVSGDCELTRARLADRLFAGIPDPERLWSHKWRGVRTSPKGVGP